MSTFEQLVLWNETAMQIHRSVRSDDYAKIDDWLTAINAAERDALEALGHPSPTMTHPRRLYGAKDPGNCWHTMHMADGRISGIWADHPAHAVVCMVAISGVEVIGVWPDPENTRGRELAADREQPALFSMLELMPTSHDSERSTD
jgi:hypothetical protein